MAKNKLLSVKIGDAKNMNHPKKKRIGHKTSSKGYKTYKRKSKTLILKDPKDSFLHPSTKRNSKQMKHKRIMRVNSIPKPKPKPKPKKKMRHKQEDVRLYRAGKISKKEYEDYYKNWFKDPKRKVKRQMSK